jgi:hypothetical protein
MVTVSAARDQAPTRVARRQRSTSAWLVAVCAVLPLAAPLVWTSPRLALQTDFVLAAVDPLLEAPFSVRSPIGLYALVLTLVWFALAYRARRAAWWEMGLVALGGAAVLVRVGNVWLEALALVVPLSRQLSPLALRRWQLAALGLAGAAAAVAVVLISRPPVMPAAATVAAVQASAAGRVLVSWRWAPELQRRAGSERLVLAASGLSSESTDFWLDYLRVAQAHERWAEILRAYDVGVVVFDARDRERSAAELIRGSSDWRVLFDDGQVLVAERAGP